jgi:DNA (cytosine-5)-methyltransferase 1
MRPRLLDLFCGAGGASVGYHRAGFDVVGVDIVRQPDYPFEFHRADALTFPLDGFDVIAASPPCKVYTVARRVSQAKYASLFDPHEDLIGATRQRLIESGRPYVIENVVGAPLIDPVIYCGSSFGLQVRRHRLFESNVALVAPLCDHTSQPHPVGVYGNGGAWKRTAPGGGGVKVAGADAAKALGVTHTAYQPSLSQMIPPAYTEHIGRQLLEALEPNTRAPGVIPRRVGYDNAPCRANEHEASKPTIPSERNVVS